MEIGTVAQWAGAIATFFAVLTALFKDEILRLWRRPKLTVSIALAPPDCHKTALTYPAPGRSRSIDCYYLRLWIQNDGRTRAERVQVFVAKLLRYKADGSFKQDEGFLPMNLCWSHRQQALGGPEIFAEGISPEMGKHCDLGHIADPNFRKEVGYDLAGVSEYETILCLDLEIRPNTLSHLLRPGRYRLQLRIAAANCAPVTTTIELTITGKWFAHQEQMFSDGLGIQVIR